MNTLLANSYICVRALNGSGVPDLPGAWTARRVGTTSWYICTSGDGETLVVAWRANSQNGEHLFALWGPRSTLDTFATIDNRCMPAQRLWNLAVGGNATAQAIVRRWPVWRFSGFERDPLNSSVVVTNGVRRLIYEGQALPAVGTAFPWRFAADGVIVATDPAARYRVSGPVGSLRPALNETIAGYVLDVLLEDEPAQ